MAVVAVSGSTGFVGRAVVRELLSKGHAVRALARDRDKARAVLPADAGDRLSVVAGTVLDGRTPAELVRGADACVHLIGILKESGGGQTFRRVKVDTTARLLAACRDAGVRRFVHMSALGVSDENRTAYQRTNWESEQLVKRSGLDWTIFRPGLIHGPEGEFIGLVKGWATGSIPPFKFMPYFKRAVVDDSVPLGPTTYEAPVVAPVAVEDVAHCFVRAIAEPRSIGEVYHLAGPDRLTWPEFLRFAHQHLPGATPGLKPGGIPGDLAAAGAYAAGLMGLGSLLPFDAGMALMGQEDSVADTTKAQDHLGLRPRPFRATFESYASRV